MQTAKPIKTNNATPFKYKRRGVDTTIKSLLDEYPIFVSYACWLISGNDDPKPRIFLSIPSAWSSARIEAIQQALKWAINTEIVTQYNNNGRLTVTISGLGNNVNMGKKICKAFETGSLHQALRLAQ